MRTEEAKELAGMLTNWVTDLSRLAIRVWPGTIKTK